jgi:glycosyltransferase involved in cell wall biosynthesis
MPIAAPSTQTGAPDALRTLVVSGPGKPADALLRRLIADDLLPDVVSADDAIGATHVDDRYLAALGGWRGRLLRRLPLLLAQAIEVWRRADEFDAVLTWADAPAIAIGTLMRLRLRLRRGRPVHVVVLMWPSKAKKALLLRVALRGIDRFIVWPPLQRRFVQDVLAVPADRFVEAHAPVDTRFWRPMSSGDGDLICSVGQEMRDYGTLIEALRPLDIRCHIAAGSGLFSPRFLDKEWRANVGEQTIPSNVTLGRRSHRDLRELFAAARFVVIPLRPSDMDNGISAIVEAFAMGKAVICTESPGQTGLLEHGVNCLRVPPYDTGALREAICELWNDRERCERLGAAGREAVEERHNLDRWTATLTEALRGAVASRP